MKLEDGSYLEQRVFPTTEQLADWTVELTAGGLPRDASGPCVHCQHPTTTRVSIAFVEDALLVSSNQRRLQRLSRQFVCACRQNHGSASVVAGCGRWWIASIVVDETGAYSVEPADERVAEAAADLNDVADRSISRLENLAEQWLKVMLGLGLPAALISLPLALSDHRSSSAQDRLAVTAIIVAAIAVAGYMGVTAFRTLVGWPRILFIRNDYELLNWRSSVDMTSVSRARRIRRAVVRGSLAWLIIATSIALVSSWPVRTPVQSIRLSLDDGTTVCGLTARDLADPIVLDVGGSRLRIVDPNEVVEAETVSEC